MEKLKKQKENDFFFLPNDIEALLVHQEESGEIIKSELNETHTLYCMTYAWIA